LQPIPQSDDLNAWTPSVTRPSHFRPYSRVLDCRLTRHDGRSGTGLLVRTAHAAR
jgi:hypothetical protein